LFIWLEIIYINFVVAAAPLLDQSQSLGHRLLLGLWDDERSWLALPSDDESFFSLLVGACADVLVVGQRSLALADCLGQLADHGRHVGRVVGGLLLVGACGLILKLFHWHADPATDLVWLSLVVSVEQLQVVFVEHLCLLRLVEDRKLLAES